jgi:hypothetical protein
MAVMSVLKRVLNPKGLLLPIALLLGIPAILWIVQSIDHIGTVENTFLLVARAVWPLLPPLEAVLRWMGIPGSVGRTLALCVVPSIAFSTLIFATLACKGIPILRAVRQGVLWGMVMLQISGIARLGVTIAGFDDPDIWNLKVYASSLRDIERIEVTPGLDEEVHVITDPAEIRQIVNGFRNASRFYDGWTQCGFHTQVNLYHADGQMHTFLVGSDDCQTFIAKHIPATGTMANDYFYNEYILKRRHNH